MALTPNQIHKPLHHKFKFTKNTTTKNNNNLVNEVGVSAQTIWKGLKLFKQGSSTNIFINDIFVEHVEVKKYIIASLNLRHPSLPL
ncbi:unnamed protein product [Meloidogyne enterolobii]|uniref:Uncharacterized protein n=1 Tax=Meloidogyne enterolobii TaxID=390850 RepID=A0ACB0YGV9_MELEN